jgi:hypothetical protein
VNNSYQKKSLDDRAIRGCDHTSSGILGPESENLRYLLRDDVDKVVNKNRNISAEQPGSSSMSHFANEILRGSLSC